MDFHGNVCDAPLLNGVIRNSPFNLHTMVVGRNCPVQFTIWRLLSVPGLNMIKLAGTITDTNYCRSSP